jgi:hypothetical protein
MRGAQLDRRGCLVSSARGSESAPRRSSSAHGRCRHEVAGNADVAVERNEGVPENANGQLVYFIAALAMSRTPAMVWSVLMWCTPLGSSHRAGALFKILAGCALLCGALHEADA